MKLPPYIHIEPIKDWSFFRGDRVMKYLISQYQVILYLLIITLFVIYKLRRYYCYLSQVEILIGKDKGKQGIVKEIIQERNWVIVEGLNTKLEHVGKNKTFPGIHVLVEQPLLVTTDVALVDPHDLYVY